VNTTEQAAHVEAQPVEAKTTPAALAKPPKKKTLPENLVALPVIFTIAFVIQIWFNFMSVHANCAGCADASEYVRLAAGINETMRLPDSFWQQFSQCASGTANGVAWEGVRAALAPLHELHQAGPVFPVVLAIATSVFGSFFAQPALDAPVLLQCILAAFTCCLIFDFSSKAWDSRVGLLSGLAAAIYPGFIINSGRLYSESFATFLSCALLCLTVRGFFAQTHLIRGFWIGVLACALQLTRSILIIFTVALTPLLAWQSGRKKSVATVCAFIAGLFVVIAPWVVLQKVAFGQGGFLVDRVGNYNLFIGTNTGTQGWLTFPYPDGTGIEKDSLPGLMLKSAAPNPGKFVRLMLDKPARLFQAPWNDFRTSIGPFSAAWQSSLHQLIFLLAGVGLCLSLFTTFGSREPSLSQVRARILLLSFFALHGLYALFITVPRYGLTAMPCVIAFAAAGLVLVLRMACAGKARAAAYVLFSYLILWAAIKWNLVPLLLDSPIPFSATIALICAAALKLAAIANCAFASWQCLSLGVGYRRLARFTVPLVFVLMTPLLVFPNRVQGRWNEWHHQVQSGAIEQTIALPAGVDWRKMPQSYLIVDADNPLILTGGSVAIDGKPLNAPVIPGLALTQNYSALRHVTDGKVYWEGEYIFDCMTQPADTANSQVRQWFFIPVSADTLANAGGTLHIRISPAQPQAGLLFGSYPEKQHQLSIPSPGVYSWEKAFYGVENEAGLTDPRLDQGFPIASARKKEPNIRLLVPQSSPGSSPGSAGVPPASSSTSTKSAVVSPAVSPTLAIYPVPSLSVNNAHPQQLFTIKHFPKFPAYALWMLRITGQARTISGTGDANLRLTATSSDKQQTYLYNSPWTLRTLPASNDWRAFDMTIPFCPGRLPGHLDSVDLTLNLHTPQWKTRTADTSTSASETRDLKIEIVKLSQNPLARFQLY